MNLQGANSRRQIQHRNRATFLNGLHQGMNLEAQQQIQLHLAVFHKQILIAAAADRDRESAVRPLPVRAADIRLNLRHSQRQRNLHQAAPNAASPIACKVALLQLAQAFRLLKRQQVETDRVARMQLAELPEFRRSRRHRANKAAKTRTVRAKQNRHIACQIQRTDRIGIIVNIGWMKPASPPSSRVQ